MDDVFGSDVSFAIGRSITSVAMEITDWSVAINVVFAGLLFAVPCAAEVDEFRWFKWEPE